MIDSVEEKIRQAQIIKEREDTAAHAERVKKTALDYMKSNNVAETPEIKANGHKVKFSDPDNIKMIVDGKEIVGKEAIDSEINRIDLIGPNMKKERNKQRIKDISKKETKNLASIAKVSAVRGAAAVPVRMSESGHRTVGALLHGLWSLLQKAMQK